VWGGLGGGGFGYMSAYGYYKYMASENYMDIMVRCPIDGQQAQEAMMLADFLETEVGQRVGGQALETADLLEKSGLNPEEAVLRAFMGAVVTTPEGKIVRASEAAELRQSAELGALESKKK